MTTATRPIEHYVEKMQTYVLKKFPHLEFEVVKYSETEATVFYRPYSEDDDYATLHRAGKVGMDALLDAGYRIHFQPA